MAPGDTPESTRYDTQPALILEAQAPDASPDGKRKRVKKPAEAWVPPKGIRYEYRADRLQMPYYLHWRDDTGQRHKQAFKNEVLRETTAKALAEKREREGTSILTFSPDEWRTYQQFKQIVGPDADPLQVAREWKAAKGVGPEAVPTLTVAEAITRYLALRDAEGGVDEGYLSHVRMHLQKSFGVRLGHVLLHELTAEQIRDWLANLRGRVRKGSTGKLGIEARRHYYRTVCGFLSRCVLEKWIEESPAMIVANPEPTKDELAASDVIKLMPVADVEALFRANRNHRVVGRLALEAFGGVRYTTAGLMNAEHIDYERKGLAMPGHIHKSRKRKFRQGHPEALWKWLEHVKANPALATCWGMTARDYYNEKRDAFIRADVRNPHNGLRHSFASYLLAVTKDLPRVSYLMQHAKTTMTEKYEGRASEQDGKQYLAIAP